MRRWAAAGVVAFALQLGFHVNADDTSPFDGWTATGTAFDGQPMMAGQITTDRIAPVTIGGDYWRRLTYPLGARGTFVVASGFVHGNGATGTLTSPPHLVTADARNFSVGIGGTSDMSHERVELLADGAVVWSATGDGYEAFRVHRFELPGSLVGRSVRVRIVDDADDGHINVDSVVFAARPLDAPPPVVWGYADYHTHPMSHLAFGGLKGMRTIWGSPGGNYDDYVRTPDRIDADLPRCLRGHGGGPFANPFLNAAQLLQFTPTANLLLFAHGQSGAPDFNDWPSFRGGAHEQMHVTQIRRNFDGGLRLMVAFATDNLGAEYLVSPVENGSVRLVDERTSVEAQLAGMIDLARRNSSWMQIAYSSAEAREIILHNRLAVVLGVEADQLGTYTCGTPRDEVDYLWNLGVRAIVPIHAMDNKIGGAAVFIGPYNWLNDLFHRKPFDMTKDQVAHTDPAFFTIEGAPCDPHGQDDGECVQFRMETTQSRLYIGRCPVLFFRTSPCLYSMDVQAYANEHHGHVNAQGLMPFGKEYLTAMMNRGIILDTAHMSDKSVHDTYQTIDDRLSALRPDCSGLSYETDVPDRCRDSVYPAIISHAHFRAQAFYAQSEFPPSDYDISNRNLELVRQVGGVVGPFVAEDRVSQPWDVGSERPFENDCAFSSKSFGYAFHFALKRMGGTGVGMATDSTFIPQTGPRFGDNACWGYHLAHHPSTERSHNHGRYFVTNQRDGVLYDGMPPKPGVVVGSNVPLTYFQMGPRKFDYNVDGLAHFGMVPDMLQDLKNVHLPRSDFEALFQSANAYLRMWERTERLARP